MQRVAVVIVAAAARSDVAAAMTLWQVAELFHARFGPSPATVGASLDVWTMLSPAGYLHVDRLIGEAWGDRLDTGSLVPRAPLPWQSQFCMVQQVPSPGLASHR